MRELMGYLVARNGGEDTAARMVAGIPQRILRWHPCRFLRHGPRRKDDRAGHAWGPDQAWINQSIGAGIAISRAPGIVHSSADTSGDTQTDSVVTGSPITIVYSRATFADDAIEEIAGAIPDLSLFDCGSRAGQAAGGGARRA